MATQEVPLGACVLSVLGGTLVALEGSLLIAGAEAVQSVLPGPSAASLAGIGGLALADGILLIVSAFLLLFSPRLHTGAGIAILTFSLLSVVAGGGFFLGALFGYVGGVLGILFVPRTTFPASNPSKAAEPETDLDDPVVEADLVDSGVLPKESADSSGADPSAGASRDRPEAPT